MPAAKEMVKIAADKADQAETDLLDTGGLLGRSKRKLENSKQAVGVASILVNTTAAKLRTYVTEFGQQKEARAKATKDSVASASAQASETRKVERAAEHAFSVSESHLNQMQDNLENVQQKTMRPALLAKEALKAAEEEEQISHTELLRRDRKVANYESASELQKSAAAEAADNAKDEQQQVVAQMNQANLHKADAESTETKAVAQSEESNTADNAATAQFGHLRSESTREKHELGQGAEEWAAAEQEHWEATREGMSRKIESQREAALEATKGARKAEADAVQTEEQSHKRIEELKDQHAALRKEFLKQHKQALDSVAQGQKEAIRAAQKVVQAEKNKQSNAELSQQAHEGRTEQVIQVATGRVDRANSRTKKRSTRAEQRATTAEAAEGHADKKVEVEHGKLVALKEQEAAARQTQEIAQVRQNAAQDALYQAKLAHRTVEQQEAVKVAKEHTILEKEKENLEYANKEVTTNVLKLLLCAKN